MEKIKIKHQEVVETYKEFSIINSCMVPLWIVKDYMCIKCGWSLGDTSAGNHLPDSATVILIKKDNDHTKIAYIHNRCFNSLND